MNERLFVPFSALSLLAFVSEVHGQQVGDRIRVNPTGQHWKECSVAARQGNANEVVFCAFDSAGGLGYSVTTDGGVNFTTGVLYPPPATHPPRNQYLGDPGAAVDPVSDRIWISAMIDLTPEGPTMTRGLSVAWKEPGDTGFGDHYVVAELYDKPLMAIGPSPGGNPPQRHYLTYSGIRNGGPNHQVWSAYSVNPTSPSPSWSAVRVEPTPSDPNFDYHGWGAMPVVLSNGRIVVAIRGSDLNEVSYNSGLPYVVYSDDGGLDWKPDQRPPVRVAEGSNIEPAAHRTVSSPGDTPYAIDRQKCAPSIAVDTTDSPNRVYVAFYARSTPGSPNTDIYISQSSDGGLTFPSDSTHLVHLTDAILGQPGGDDGADQFTPAIAIDPCGGVNVFFYNSITEIDPGGGHRAVGDNTVTVHYVRITDFGTPSQVIRKFQLGSEFTVGTSVPYGGFLGDYHHFAVAGPTPTLYPAYIALAQGVTGGPWDQQNCYTHQIRVFCLADFNQDEFVDGLDHDLFNAAFENPDPSQQMAADLNGDGFVDGFDYDLFLAHFESGC